LNDILESTWRGIDKQLDEKVQVRRFEFKFRDEGNNRTTQYVETSTLLEPNNFIPSWVKILC